MNRLIKTSTALGAAMLFSANVFAADITVNPDFSTGNVNVSCDFGYADNAVTVRIIGPFSTQVDYSEVQESAADKIFENSYVNQLYTDSNGVVSFDCEIGTAAANYIIVLNCGGDKEIYYYFSVSPEKIAELIEKINSTESPEEIFAILSSEEAVKNLNLTSSVYCALSENAQKKLCAVIAGEKLEGYESLLERLNILGCVFYLNDGNDTDKAAEYIDKYIDLSGLKMYSEYKNLTGQQKKSVVSRMMKNTVTNPGEFNRVYEESVFLELISSVVYSDNITSVIDKYASYFSIDTRGYSAVSMSVNRKIESYAKKNGFYNLTDFKQKLAGFIAEASSINTGGGGGGNGGGSSSSGGSQATNRGIVTIGSAVKENTNEENSLPFSDIAGFTWAHKAIKYLAHKNIVSGKGNGIFAPSDSITREEFVKIICGAFSVTGTVETIFTDTDKNAWYYPFIQSAYAAGIINGRDDGSFGVGEAVLREESAAIIMRALQMSADVPDGPEKTFDDEELISGYAVEAVKTLSRTNVINGDDGNFRPHSPITRAEACKMIYEAVMLCE